MTIQEAMQGKGYLNYKPIDQVQNIANKKRIMAIMQHMLNTPLTEMDNAIQASYHADASVSISHPLNELSSAQEVGERFWQPLRHALPDVERRSDILAGGAVSRESFGRLSRSLRGHVPE